MVRIEVWRRRVNGIAALTQEILERLGWRSVGVMGAVGAVGAVAGSAGNSMFECGKEDTT